MKNKKILMLIAICSFIIFICCYLYTKNNYEGAFNMSWSIFFIYLPITFGIQYFKQKTSERSKETKLIINIITYFIIFVCLILMIIFLLYEPFTYIYATVCILYILGVLFKKSWVNKFEEGKNGVLKLIIFVYILSSFVYMIFPLLFGLKTIGECEKIIKQNGYNNIEHINISRRGNEDFGNYNFYVDGENGERVIISINPKTLEIE